MKIILIIISIELVNSSTICSIFPLLNCSCYHSNYDLNFSYGNIYSHLHCQGYILNKKTFQIPFGNDFKYQNSFRTISIELFLKNQIEISSNQFDSLSLLFSQTDNNAQIEISIRFNGFNHIKLNKYSFTSNIFQKKHQNKRLWLHFIPIITNYNQIESGENNSTNIEDQFTFSENCFSGLIVSQLNLYIHTKNHQVSSLYPFEHIFNNTNIGELHFYGSIIPPGPSYLRRTFKGLIRSLTLHRHVDTIDSLTFPYYFPVYSYNIHSNEAHSIDLDSFIPLYNNLRGLELIKPRFEVSIDKYIPSLDSLTLDIEYLNERTLLSAGHIHYLKLGTRLRRINSQVLYFLSNNLRTFDLYNIDLSEMTSDSRCYLIDFIYDNYKYQRQLNIILPEIKTLTECDCAKFILNDIQLNKNLKNDLLCSKQCRFSDCLVISEYFREKYPLFINDNHLTNIINEKIDDHLPIVDIFSDPNDVHLMSFLINQTNNQPISTSTRRSTTTTTTTERTITYFQVYDDSLYSTPDYFNPIDEDKNELSNSKENKSPWILFLIVGIVILIIIITIIVVIYAKYKKRNHFKRVPVYV